MGRKAADLVGRRFGDLTVVSRAESRPVGKHGKLKIYWHCQCSCGRSCEVPTSNLTSGNTSSCGKHRVAHNRVDLTGQRFERLTVIQEVEIENNHRQNIYWECRCDCGAIIVVPTNNLTNGNSRSCGCLRIIHGYSNNSPIYKIWTAMLSRCRNENNPRYRHYGGRGIYVDPRWEKFENFLADMGEQPQGRSLDRIDNNGPYSPENCRWATRTMQDNNRSNNRFVTYKGRTQTVTQWAIEVGLPGTVLNKRIVRGWNIERAMTTPVMKWSHRH